MKEENERTLKQQEQDEILTISKEDISQVNKNKSFKIPNTKNLIKRSISKQKNNNKDKNKINNNYSKQNGKNRDHLKRRKTIESSTTNSIEKNRKKFNLNNNNDNNTTTIKNRPNLIFPSRQSTRISIRSTRLNRSL